MDYKVDTSKLSPEELELIKQIEQEAGKPLAEILHEAMENGEDESLTQEDFDELPENVKQTILDRTAPEN
jgi:hypothetical protein